MESAEGFESTAQIAHNLLNHACPMHTHMNIKTFFSSTTSYGELKKKNRGPETTISAVCTGITHMSTHLIFKAHILFWLHLCSNLTTSPVWWSFSGRRQGLLNIIRTAEWWNLMPVNYPGCCCLVVLASADHWWRRFSQTLTRRRLGIRVFMTYSGKNLLKRIIQLTSPLCFNHQPKTNFFFYLLCFHLDHKNDLMDTFTIFSLCMTVQEGFLYFSTRGQLTN